MGEERRSAYTMYYEPSELDGKRLYGTGYGIDHATVPEGFYCYDVFNDGLGDTGDHTFISRYLLKENLEGAVITTEPLDFQGRVELSLKAVKFLEEEPAVSLEQLVEQKAANQKIETESEFNMVQG